jgi:hypothetical protein
MSAVTTAEKPTFFVPLSRLARGEDIGESAVGPGDIMGSFSADRIAEGKPVRKPFQFQDSLWVCTGAFWSGEAISKDEAYAYRLVPKESFNGNAGSYEEMSLKEYDPDAPPIENPAGLYDGMIVRFRSKDCVLCGPETTFKVDPEQSGTGAEPGREVQLKLF